MKFCLKIFFCLSINIVISVVNAKDLRIVGGEDARIEDFPYIASFRLANNIEKQSCGGSIISHYHILTAAHCFIGLTKDDYIVFIGNTLAPTASTPFYKIKRIKIHPKFVGTLDIPSRVHNDIAIATVEPCITFNAYQNKIKLPTKNVKSGAFAEISGWGRTKYPTGESSKVLQKATMVIVHNHACGGYFPFPIYKQNVCAFQRPGVGVCYGDSGGPLVSDGVLVGISSFVRPCAIGEPDVYTRVYSYLDFIMSTISPAYNFFSCIKPSTND